jgi:6-pyruvoyltetrahydropterin/6-carboxytetrahydropterin synthase
MTYQSTKTYGHDVGLSTAFRQWTALSHCHFLHGYALAVRFVFEADELDANNWCIDFGGMKSLKQWLHDTFDHKTVVAQDDPSIEWFREGQRIGTLDLIELPATGCEKFAEFIYAAAQAWMDANGYSPRCRLVSVEVIEHGANSALFAKSSGAHNVPG